MSGLPRGWVEATLGEIGEWSSGGTPSRARSDYYDGDIPWVKTGDLEDRVLLDTPEKITQAGLNNSSAKLFPPGTLLIAMYGATIGKTALLGVPAATNQACAAFLPSSYSEELIPFLWKFVFAKKAEFIAAGQGGAQPNISQALIKQFPILIPPLAEQKRIVAKLDALNAKSARARTELARIQTLVSRYKQAVLRSAFLGGMTSEWRARKVDLPAASDLIASTPTPPQPRGGRDATDRVIQGKAALAVNTPPRQAPPKWQWVPLNRIARQETGHTPSRSHPEWWEGNIPWIGIKDAGAHHGMVIEETIQTTNEEGLANSAARLLPAGTVCLSRTASVGYVTIMGKPMATSQDFVTWTCTGALVPRFLMYALMAEGDDIREFGKGTTHTTIYFPEVRAMQICLAPLEEQHEIVRRIEAAFARIDRLAKEAKRALELVGRLDEAILAKAFRGELVPQDENDEPAEHLLARIRAERAAAPKARRGRGAKA